MRYEDSPQARRSVNPSTGKRNFQGPMYDDAHPPEPTTIKTSGKLSKGSEDFVNSIKNAKKNKSASKVSKRPTDDDAAEAEKIVAATDLSKTGGSAKERQAARVVRTKRGLRTSKEAGYKSYGSTGSRSELTADIDDYITLMAKGNSGKDDEKPAEPAKSPAKPPARPQSRGGTSYRNRDYTPSRVSNSPIRSGTARDRANAADGISRAERLRNQAGNAAADAIAISGEIASGGAGRKRAEEAARARGAGGPTASIGPAPSNWEKAKAAGVKAWNDTFDMPDSMGELVEGVVMAAPALAGGIGRGRGAQTRPSSSSSSSSSAASAPSSTYRGQGAGVRGNTRPPSSTYRGQGAGQSGTTRPSSGSYRGQGAGQSGSTRPSGGNSASNNAQSGSPYRGQGSGQSGTVRNPGRGSSGTQGGRATSNASSARQTGAGSGVNSSQGGSVRTSQPGSGQRPGSGATRSGNQGGSVRTSAPNSGRPNASAANRSAPPAASRGGGTGGPPQRSQAPREPQPNTYTVRQSPPAPQARLPRGPIQAPGQTQPRLNAAPARAASKKASGAAPKRSTGTAKTAKKAKKAK